MSIEKETPLSELPPKKDHRHGHRQRIKDKFAQTGFLGWTDREILEYCLFYCIPQGDVSAVVDGLLQMFGTLSGVLDADLLQLMKVKGVGRHTAHFLKFLPAVSREYFASRTRVTKVVNCAADAIPHLIDHFRGKNIEVVYALFLDGRNQVLGVRKIAEGSILATDVNTRQIVKEGMILDAVSIYLAHNHVASLALPSRPDFSSTQLIYHALLPVGIYLTDHLIFTDDDMVSIRETYKHKKLYLPW